MYPSHIIAQSDTDMPPQLGQENTACLLDDDEEEHEEEEVLSLLLSVVDA